MGRFHLPDLPRRFAWWASTPTGLLWLFAIGFLIRFWLATRPGFWIDMNTFRAWADRMAERGPGGFYPPHVVGEGPDDGFFVDYPPGYLYVLWFLGALSRRLTGGPPPDTWLKLPPVLADMALAWVVVRVATALTPAAYRRFPWRGTAAAAVLLNPALIVVSALWGQADVFLGLLVVSGLLLLGTGRATFPREAAGLALVVAAIATKPQALFVVPVVVCVLVWRHVRGALEDPGRRRLAVAVARVAGLGAASVAAALVIVLPFGVGPVQLVRFYAEASGTYPYTSAWAFNLWGAVAGFWRPDSGAAAFPTPAAPAFALGMVVFVLGTAAVVWRAWRSLSRGESEGRVLLLGSLAMTLLAFSVLTRIHERYLFLAVACIAPLVAYRALRRSTIVLSGLYLVNVWFSYGYYTFFSESDQRREASAWHEALVNAVLGQPMTDAFQLRAWALVTGVFCLFVAWRGWTWMEARSGAERAVAAPEPARGLATVTPIRSEPRRWTLELRPVGAKGAAIGLAVLAVALATRLVGLSDPPGMYFDEVYHARTAGEYLQGREVYEWTHPPLAKELMAVSTVYLSRFGVRTAPDTTELGAPIAGGGDDVLFATYRRRGVVQRLRVEADCTIRPEGRPLGPLEGRISSVGVHGDTVTVGTAEPGGGSLHRWVAGRSAWTVTLPAAPVGLVSTSEALFAITDAGDLLLVTPEGTVEPLDTGAGGIAFADRTAGIWATFPSQGLLVSFDPQGVRRDTAVVTVRPGPVTAPLGSDRVLVSDVSGARTESVDEGTRSIADKPDLPFGADLLSTVPRSGLAWASEGTTLRVVEPRGLAVIGEVGLPGFPSALAPVEGRGSMVTAIDGVGLACVSGDAPFAWRFGSALLGAVMIMFVYLIALRLFGSLPAALLAAFFLTVCGLAFTMSRIAMNDSYVTAFVLGAWFCVLSALYRWGAGGSRSRPAALGWVAACGVFLGLALATKWVGLFALGGIGLLLLWDLATRLREGVWTLAGPLVTSLLVLGVLLVVVPAVVYVLAYLPYFRLGNSFGQFLQLQGDMYSYHARLGATHPYASSPFLWPFGRRAVYLHLFDAGGGRRAEMWTAANPVVFLGGLVAMVGLAAHAVRRRSVAGAVVVGAALVQFLPWVRVTRVVFLYHYLPVVPFLAIALGWWLAGGPPGQGDSTPRVRRLWTVLISAAALAAFAALLPLLAGWTLPGDTIATLKSWTRWMF